MTYKKNESTKMILVCETKDLQCDKAGFTALVGNTTHLFCCEKGFLSSLEDFTKFINKPRTP